MRALAPFVFLLPFVNTSMVLQGLPLHGGSASGGVGTSFVEDSILECTSDARRFTAWDWNQESPMFDRVLRVQIINAYKDSTHSSYSHSLVRITAENSSYSARIPRQTPIELASLSLHFQSKLDNGSEVSFGLVNDSEDNIGAAGWLYSERTFGPIEIDLSNCVDSGKVHQQNLLPESTEMKQVVRLEKSSLRSEEFTKIVLEKSSAARFSVYKETLTARHLLGENFACSADVYKGSTWAIRCLSNESQVEGETQKELVFVTYDGRLFYAVTRDISTVNSGEIEIIESGLFLITQ